MAATMTENSYFHHASSSAVLHSLNLCSSYFPYTYPASAGLACSCPKCLQAPAKIPAPPTTNDSSFAPPAATAYSSYLRGRPYYDISGKEYTQRTFRNHHCTAAYPTGISSSYGTTCCPCSLQSNGTDTAYQSSQASTFNGTVFSGDYSQHATAVSEAYSTMGAQYPPTSSEYCSLSQSVSPPQSVGSPPLPAADSLSRHSSLSPNHFSDLYASSPENDDSRTEGASERPLTRALQSSKCPVEVKGPAYRSHFGNRQPRKDRLCFTPDQIQQLEANFLLKKYLCQAERLELAGRVGISEAQVKTWYQNRRTKWKRGHKVST